MPSNTSQLVWAFFGTSEFSVIVLDELKLAGYIPALIVTGEDKPKGRKLILTPPPAKVWAEKENIPFLQLKTIRTPEAIEAIRKHAQNGFDFFIVASYGKIIPSEILDMPRHKTLNVHPSLLPKLRGASPIQSAILFESETGVTIMRLDQEMDHGPILAEQKINITDWPPYAEDLEKALGKAGGKLLAETLPGWIDGTIPEKEQDHAQATFTKKIEKTDGLLDLTAPAEENLRKVRAYHLWPGAYFFVNRGGKELRVIVRRARIENGALVLERVVPEGKPEMNYEDFARSYLS